MIFPVHYASFRYLHKAFFLFFQFARSTLKFLLKYSLCAARIYTMTHKIDLMVDPFQFSNDTNKIVWIKTCLHHVININDTRYLNNKKKGHRQDYFLIFNIQYFNYGIIIIPFDLREEDICSLLYLYIIYLSKRILMTS